MSCFYHEPVTAGIDFWLQISGSRLLPYGVELCYLDLGDVRLLAASSQGCLSLWLWKWLL